MEELTNLEFTEEELKELSPEELADLKIKLEELAIRCEELLEEEE